MNSQALGLVAALLFLAGPPAFSQVYTVQKGDTPSLLAARNKMPLDVLRGSNPAFDWDHLKVGDRVTFPDRHVVAAGETLYSLCRLWGVDQAAVLALNGLGSGTSLKVGQTLFIPLKAASPGPSGPAPGTPRAPTARPAATPGAKAPSAPPFWPVDRKPRAQGDKLRSVVFPTTGEAFRSVTSGTVVFLGEFRGVGRVLLVQGTDRRVFAYGNFESASVAYGQSVDAGQVLGLTSTRNAQGLTFFAFLQNEPLDVLTAKR